MTKKLYLDIDYNDLCWRGDGGKAQLVRIFDKMVECGFSGAVIDCFCEGDAFFPSARFAPYRNRFRAPNMDRTVTRLGEFPVLEFALGLARERHLRLLPYLRLNDDAWAPAHGNGFFRAHPEYFLASRCGNYILYGRPCFAYDEVREHFLARMDELIALGFPGIHVGTARCHTMYFSGWVGGPEEMRMWGFNPPLTDEYRRRTGVDLTRIGTIRHAAVPDAQRVCKDFAQTQVTYEDCADCDFTLLRRIHGEAVEVMLREFRRRHPAAAVSIEAHHSNVLPGFWPVDAIYMFDLDAMLKERLIDEFMTFGNFQGRPDAVAEARQAVPQLRAAQAPFGVWLNDILSPSGGEAVDVTAADVRGYVGRIHGADCDNFYVHEADFIEKCPERDAIWRELAGLTR